MTPPRLRLDEALDQIVAAATTRLDAATAAGELLEGVQGVVSGERARRRPDPPYVWVTIGGWEEDDRHAIHTKVTANVMVSAFVASETPEDGWLESMVLAARARSVLLADRELGLDWVKDVKAIRGGPVGRIRDGRRFGSFARLDVEATILEGE